ncbi:putative component of NuA3 histone acetyltransferase complex [Lecanora helva]
MAKRKADQIDDLSSIPPDAKRHITDHHEHFRDGLFDQDVLDTYAKSYHSSIPYRHGVIQDLIEPVLLRKVRSEIQNLSFTPKETDIYKIHQSGDLANLDGLDDSSLKLLPSLLILRNALYSPAFRQYLSHITGSGPLSGEKTDMAINIYVPGCHLLCHDDVIGSRRVSYILYLTDPDRPWQKEWGGALRLYPTQANTEDDGTVTKVPSSDHSISIPPAFNQLSFFAVQPGESFHDVEEVYGLTDSNGLGKSEERARIAISGWYHIPQKEEDGYEEGLEERLTEKSSLMQLQGKAEKYDQPKANVQTYSTAETQSGLPTPSSQEDLPLSPEEIDFLLKYIAPTYLTPDPLKEVSDIFAEECSICLESFVSTKFSNQIKEYAHAQESQLLPSKSVEIEETTSWKVARPPHKHRFLFQEKEEADLELSPLQDVIQNLLPSRAFQKWLSLATGFQIISHDCRIRRFRKGQDYTLATSYEEDSPRIELCLSFTPTSGWGDDQPQDPEGQSTEKMNVESEVEGEKEVKPSASEPDEDATVGGYLAYMVGDEDKDDDNNADAVSDNGVEVPPNMSTGAKSTKAAVPKKLKQDPAIYKAGGDDEEDGILFSMPASWNRLGIVLRDKGTMRFVKYVSRMAKGDRWDIVGEFEIVDDGDDEDENEAKEDTDAAAGALRADENDDDSTEIEDISDSDSDSDD